MYPTGAATSNIISSFSVFFPAKLASPMSLYASGSEDTDSAIGAARGISALLMIR